MRSNKTNYDEELKNNEIFDRCKLEYSKYLVCKDRGWTCFSLAEFELDLTSCIYKYHDEKIEAEYNRIGG